jgi:hypothetical protein
VFSVSPVGIDVISTITPIGNLNPPDHTLPTNHSYIFHAQAPNPDVFAPAGGTVSLVNRGVDDSVYVTVSPGFIYYFGHIKLDASIARGNTITAGQKLGTSPTTLDFGVENRGVTLFFVRPERYINETLHADSAVRYFTEPVRSQLLAKINRTGDDKYGRIDFDQSGRLSGNWFLPDLPVSTTENFGNGPKHLSFARDVNDPSRVRISIGGSLSVAGSFVVPSGAIDPANVTVGTGKVGYSLAFFVGQAPVGVLIAQMLADDQIKVQTFSGSTASPDAGFTEAALTYAR